MATEVIWTNRASRNLQSIHTYISNDSVFYATRFVKHLVQSVNQQLSFNPLTGRSIPEFEGTHLSHLREVIFKGYRVIYETTDLPDKVLVLAVSNGRQELRNVNTEWDID